jgi:hypothetical protein
LQDKPHLSDTALEFSVELRQQGRFMKKFAILGLMAMALVLSSCGNDQTAAAADTSGNWQAVLTGGAGEASVLSFNTSFSVNNDGSLSVSNLAFLTTGTCFVSGGTASGTATVTTDSTGLVTGSVNYVVQSGSPAGNTLTLVGTEDGTTITGTWTLTGGEGCTGAGDFTMKRS